MFKLYNGTIFGREYDIYISFSTSYIFMLYTDTRLLRATETADST